MNDQTLSSIHLHDVQGFCPACGHPTLYVGAGGHLVCSLMGCPKPEAADEVLRHAHETECEHAASQRQAETERDGAYRERAHLVALLAAMTDAAVIAPALDLDEPGWWIVYLTIGGRQASWHISPRDAGLFTHVERVEPDDLRAQWDGHTTEQKYAHIRRMAVPDGPGPEETDTTQPEPGPMPAIPEGHVRDGVCSACGARCQTDGITWWHVPTDADCGKADAYPRRPQPDDAGLSRADEEEAADGWTQDDDGIWTLPVDGGTILFTQASTPEERAGFAAAWAERRKAEPCDDCLAGVHGPNAHRKHLLDTPDTITDPAWLRTEYAEAIKSIRLRLMPDPIVMTMIQAGSGFHLKDEEAWPFADAVMRVRDRDRTRLAVDLAQTRADRDWWKNEANRPEETEAQRQRDQFATDLAEEQRLYQLRTAQWERAISGRRHAEQRVEQLAAVITVVLDNDADLLPAHRVAQLRAVLDQTQEQ